MVYIEVATLLVSYVSLVVGVSGVILGLNGIIIEERERERRQALKECFETINLLEDHNGVLAILRWKKH